MRHDCIDEHFIERYESSVHRIKDDIKRKSTVTSQSQNCSYSTVQKPLSMGKMFMLKHLQHKFALRISR